MKILFVTPYITSKAHTEFQKNQTGFGYMVHDIAEYIAKTQEVDLFSATTFTPSFVLDGFNVIGRSWFLFIKNIRLANIIDGIKFILKYKRSLIEQLRTLYLFMSIGQIESIMYNYDIVHIHGCSELTDAVIGACRRKNKPFLVTLHGLNSFSVSIRQNKAMKQYERDFLRIAAINHYPISFISSGNLNMAIEAVGIDVDSFHLVCNGCDVTQHDAKINVREMYGLSDSDFVFAFIGNISYNKNQLQVAKSWCLLPKDLRSKCKVLFVGKYKNEDDIVKYIEEKNLQNNLILCGMQPKDMIPSYLQACDATILTSITEGFGLSIIEGFVYGKPNVTFQDLPAIPDLYCKEAMVLCKDRFERALAEAMINCINLKFDKNIIINHAKKFSYEVMAYKYVNLLKSICSK